MKTLLLYADRHRAALLVAFVLAAAASGAALAQPLAAKNVIDAVYAGTSAVESLLLLTGLVLACALANAVAAWSMQRTGERIVLEVRRSLAHRVLRLQMAEVERRAI